MSCFIHPLLTLFVGLREHGHIIGVMKCRPLSELHPVSLYGYVLYV